MSKFRDVLAGDKSTGEKLIPGQDPKRFDIDSINEVKKTNDS